MLRYLSNIAPHASFESLYLEVRSREDRLLEDRIVAMLPYVTAGDVPNADEWAFRARSFEQLKVMLGKRKHPGRLLDIGCGNGWAAAGLADYDWLEVAGVDINDAELKQADRVFEKPNLSFYYGNIFEDIFPVASFDYITLCASAQYFNDFQALVRKLLSYLKEDGAIHILDTPFYRSDEIYAAKARTRQYYSSLGFPDMSNHYFHHNWSSLQPFSYELMGDRSLIGKLKTFLGRQTGAHLNWIMIRK